jgi:RNA polymerase sigma-70 factor (ECF subfamily)
LNSIARKIEGFANFLFLNSSNSTGRADAQSQGDELEVAIGRLNAEDRLVLVMFYLEELPGDEVAEILAVKPETLHVRLHRARKRLKKILAEAQGDE